MIAPFNFRLMISSRMLAGKTLQGQEYRLQGIDMNSVAGVGHVGRD